jgi:hypothetical protein
VTAKCEPCMDDRCHECDAYADLDQMTTEALADHDEGWCCCTIGGTEELIRRIASWTAVDETPADRSDG